MKWEGMGGQMEQLPPPTSPAAGRDPRQMFAALLLPPHPPVPCQHEGAGQPFIFRQEIPFACTY